MDGNFKLFNKVFDFLQEISLFNLIPPEVLSLHTPDDKLKLKYI